MKNKKILITSGACLIPSVFGVLIYNQLPAKLPIHWNFSGQIDSYGNKAIVVFGLPVLMCLIQAFMMFMLINDPKGRSHSNKMIKVVSWIIPGLTIIIEAITFAVAFGYHISINFVIPLLIGIIFIILGNYLPKCRQNYMIGYRLPWTLNNRENWNRTNRLAGYIMVIGGLITIIASFFNVAFYALLVVVLVLVVVPFIYSFLIYRSGL